MTAHARQWGGRFAEPPDPALHAYGSSLEDDLILAPFDVRCSHAHVEALFGGGIVSETCAAELHAALDTVQMRLKRRVRVDCARIGRRRRSRRH